MTSGKFQIPRFLGVEDIRDGQSIRDDPIQSPHFTDENTETRDKNLSSVSSSNF